ncbi:MAG: HAMP domain-containing histidine kinase [Saprospiraceae bacterium]|jgi:two-component system phosphate regulon sensor histidine kinase PhoR|uniref:sensor histidine kinase n=1 Tax=Candidatus Brachybacter algidus TaxID=2982024 RepID=UPI001B74D6E0|nr:HAMP domain-containing sensor histidine kinase [Candidatus Brachybacter algidus]MBP8893949.1 HAMP domain-containing histidine kinase [Saprospiraceae bacterium]MBK6373211.1 HAMP domain-containing histidine kinase [Candidatus Brachybacter algidus]MBK6447863.1 HAMP domain-containing histidine kinase [Candidatus Brachybacter algidus]MBK7602674.1 HAMP domain-containing histidine kinase [Candidatus Brachybacter algidus]MBK8746895.1 HAMP domain-containing histidine kinase [Candidatus Brachybacter 
MTRSKVRLITIIGTLAIAAIIVVQGYWVLQMWNYKEKEFSQTVKVSLYRVAKQLVELNGSVLPNTGIINQMSSNYFVVNVNDKIQADHVEYFLRKEFQKVLINEDFEFGIYDCSNDQVVYGNYIKANAEPIQNFKEKSILPTHEGFTYYFVVFFPNRSTSLIANLMYVFLFSLLLLIALGVFVYSIFVIVKQNELSELQKDFINNMTHEFKTPLASILLASGAISSNPKVKDDSVIQRLTGIIDQQNKRLISHVEKILELAKLEKNKFLLFTEKLELNNVIREMLPALELRIENVQGVMNINLSNEDIFILADKIHLTNVLDNLIDNAIKYSINNPVIYISSSIQKGKVILSIEDNGVGMDIVTQKKVFQKFYRHHTGNVHDVKGFGLGLFYVKNICNALNWKLKIESTPAQGTKIFITIPKV